MNLSRDNGDQHSSHGSDNPDALYNVLNDHWRHQFVGYILERDQVVIDPRPLSKGNNAFIFYPNIFGYSFQLELLIGNDSQDNNQIVLGICELYISL